MLPNLGCNCGSDTLLEQAKAASCKSHHLDCPETIEAGKCRSDFQLASSFALLYAVAWPLRCIKDHLLHSRHIMACHLLSLPQELQNHIIGIIESWSDSLATLISWSCTCSAYRLQLAPYIFKDIRLCNTEKSGTSVKAIIEGHLAKHVKKLRYEALFLDVQDGNAAADDHSDEGDDVDESDDNDNDSAGEVVVVERESRLMDQILPSVVRTTLSDLAKFPNLWTLTVRFGLDTTAYVCLWDVIDDREYSANDENNVAWRALICASFKALATNQATSLRRLELLDWIALEVAAYTSDGWHALLRSLDNFRLTLCGCENGAGWHQSTLDVYQQCVDRLDAYFFSHLTAVTDLAVEASPDGPLGMESTCRLMIEAQKMPALTTLYLENMFIGPDLVAFLVGRRDTLASVELVNFYGSEVESDEQCGCTPWYALFDAVREARPTRLRRFVLRELNAPLTIDESYPPRDDSAVQPEGDEVREVREALRADPSRRVFPYAYLDGKYGFIRRDEDLNVDMFRLGVDQTAYDQLMDLVAKNQRRAA